MQLHLFENMPFEPPPKNNPHESKYQRFKRLNNYRKSSDAERRCQNCRHSMQNYFDNRAFLKCDLIGVSRSKATDIRASYICNKYESEILDKSKIKIEMTNGAVITPDELEEMTKCNCMLCDKLGFTEDGLFKCYVTGEVMTHEGDAIAYNCKHYKEWKE